MLVGVIAALHIPITPNNNSWDRRAMRFLCFGVGAIGSYIGGSLALSGEQVVFLERPEVAEQVRQRGLRLALPDGEHHIEQPDVVGSIDAALERGPFDLAILAVKSFDTRPLLQGLLPYATFLPPVLSLQNGVENEAAIASALGEGQAIAGSVTSAVGRSAAGNVTLEKLRGVGIAAGHPLSVALVAAMNDAGLNAHLYPNALAMKWSKMLTNLLANASSAILDMPPAQIFAHRGLYRMELRMLNEALSVMGALSIPVVNLPGTPVRPLVLVATVLPPALSKPLLSRALGGGRGGKMPSFHIDLHNRRGQSEVDYLNGAVVRFGARAGVSATVNRFLNATLLSLARGELPIDTYAGKPEKLLTDLDNYQTIIHGEDEQ